MNFKLALLSLLSFFLGQSAFALHLGFPLKRHQTNQLIINLFSSDKNPPPTLSLPSMGKTVLGCESIFSHEIAKTGKKEQSGYQHLLLLNLEDQEQAEFYGTLLENEKDILWVSPNYLYEGDPREQDFDEEEVSPQGDQEIQHLIMHDNEAWEISAGKDILIAVTDDGINYNHPDLLTSILLNEKEIPDNGIDDDGNGFIDDIMGWNFTDQNNDISAKKNGHGTFVSALINGNRDGHGVTGTAPDAKILPIKFFGGNLIWSSLLVARSYGYAVNRGAKIINTSYTVDQMVDDQVYLEAVRHAYDKGLLILNSAGNNRDNQPPRIVVHQLLLIAATDTSKRFRDQRSYFSNFGRGIDLSAPGNDLISATKEGGYEKNGGTSFSTPIAAAAAALVWSHFPDYNRDQVWSRLTALSDDIDNKHIEYYKGKMGAGRVNTLRALTQNIPAPRVRGLEKIDAINPIAPIEELQLNLRNVLTPGVTNFLTATQITNTDSGEQIAIKSTTPYLLGTNVIKYRLFEQLPPGHYRFQLLAHEVRDPFEQELDGNEDGIGGDDWQVFFTVTAKGKEISYDE